MSEEIEWDKYTHVGEVTCPYCGHEHGDSWEFTDDDDDHECHDCGKHFAFSRRVDVTYTSRKKPEAP